MHPTAPFAANQSPNVDDAAASYMHDGIDLRPCVPRKLRRSDRNTVCPKTRNYSSMSSLLSQSNSSSAFNYNHIASASGPHDFSKGHDTLTTAAESTTSAFDLEEEYSLSASLTDVTEVLIEGKPLVTRKPSPSTPVKTVASLRAPKTVGLLPTPKTLGSLPAAAKPSAPKSVATPKTAHKSGAAEATPQKAASKPVSSSPATKSDATAADAMPRKATAKPVPGLASKPMPAAPPETTQKATPKPVSSSPAPKSGAAAVEATTAPQEGTSKPKSTIAAASKMTQDAAPEPVSSSAAPKSGAAAGEAATTPQKGTTEAVPAVAAEGPVAVSAKAKMDKWKKVRNHVLSNNKESASTATNQRKSTWKKPPHKLVPATAQKHSSDRSDSIHSAPALSPFKKKTIESSSSRIHSAPASSQFNKASQGAVDRNGCNSSSNSSEVSDSRQSKPRQSPPAMDLPGIPVSVKARVKAVAPRTHNKSPESCGSTTSSTVSSDKKATTEIHTQPKPRPPSKVMTNVNAKARVKAVSSPVCKTPENSDHSASNTSTSTISSASGGKVVEAGPTRRRSPEDSTVTPPPTSTGIPAHAPKLRNVKNRFKAADESTTEGDCTTPTRSSSRTGFVSVKERLKAFQKDLPL